MKIFTQKIAVSCVAVVMWLASGSAVAQQANSPLERRADRAFIRGDYDKAMELNRQADEKLPEGTLQKSRLELKMARMYILLQQPTRAIEYYETVRHVADTLLTVDDVCLYIDALRNTGEAQRAEVVARSYAFRSPYSRNQRYMNTFYSLSNRQHYYAKGDAEYKVKLWEGSTSLPEYWLGNFDGSAFYAVSHSPIQDPLKVFYHRTQYFALGDNEMPVPLRSIPRELQIGPVAFSKDKSMMVSTGIDYKSNDRIVDLYETRAMFSTQLYYSVIDTKRGGWSNFKPLFPYQQGSCYAHPALFNNDRSLVFSSNRPGGYGGMDLYVCHWDETARKWGDPVNLGPTVNTEGDEIYPLIVNGYLFFSSNGQEGYGGYDIYRISFGHNIVLAGSLFHYPYPVNSVANDFGVYFAGGKEGYFISDRRGAEGRDDIYTFDGSVSPLGSDRAIGVSSEYSAMMGNLNLITGLGNSNTQTFEKDLLVTPVYAVPDAGEVLLSIYFDFNSYVIDSESLIQLRNLIADKGVNSVQELGVIGYADELGSMPYNQRLSERRAQTVAKFLTKNGIKPALFVEGRGQIQLSPSDFREEMEREGLSVRTNHIEMGSVSGLDLDERIKLNRKARRVDVIVKKK